MRMKSETQIKEEYAALLKKCVIDSAREKEIAFVVGRINDNKSRYNHVSEKTKVPWYVIATIHSLECSLDFTKHLHNGDPLYAKTRRVPKGRPPFGTPSFTWEDSAADAITYAWLTWNKFEKMEDIMYSLESYNGFGYRRNKINSPYLWACTNQYVCGKFGKDGKFDKDLVSKQVGGVVILKRLLGV